jgi:hypothetical protein
MIIKDLLYTEDMNQIEKKKPANLVIFYAFFYLEQHNQSRSRREPEPHRIAARGSAKFAQLFAEPAPHQHPSVPPTASNQNLPGA